MNLQNLNVVTDEKHKPFLKHAYDYAWQNSEDNATKVGAIILSQNLDEILSYGANKYPEGLNPTREQKENKNWKYNNIHHAEKIAIDNMKCKKQLEQSTMYLTWIPCKNCADLIIPTGIKTVIGHKETLIKTHEKWEHDVLSAINKLEKQGINVQIYSGKIGNTQSLFNYTTWKP